MVRKYLLVVALILMSTAVIFANGNGEEEAMAIEVMDGYKSADVDEAGVNVQWMIEGDQLHIQMSAMTTGWIAVGFEPSRQMKDANIIIGYVEDGEVFLRDDWGVANTRHGADAENGGTDDLSDIAGSEADGVTTISFVIPLDSGDATDKALAAGGSYKMIAAAGPDGKDDFGTYHAKRGSTQIEL